MKKGLEVATLTTTDLQSAGINSQLTSNDLVEVVAHDIYNKITDSISEKNDRYKELKRAYDALFDKEFEVMKNDLFSAKHFNAEEIKLTTQSIYPENNKYWNNTHPLKYISVIEKEKGTKIEENDTALGFVKGKEVKVRINVSLSDRYKEVDIAVKGIVGTIDTTVNKSFTKIISVSESKWSGLFKEIDIHNKEVDNLLKLIPSTGLLSVERFTREARVKMNKKIISAQSAEFRQKISELFNIKL